MHIFIDTHDHSALYVMVVQGNRPDDYLHNSLKLDCCKLLQLQEGLLLGEGLP